VIDISPDITVLWIEKCVYTEGKHIDAHSHEFFHFICHISGNGVIFNDNREHKLEDGKIYLTMPGIVHEFCNTVKEDLVTYEVKFEINDQFLKEKIQKLPFEISANDQPISNIFTTMYIESKKKEPLHREMICADMYRLLILLQRSVFEENSLSSADKDHASAGKEDVIKVLAYLEKNMHNDISLEQMAKLVHLEKIHFLKKFKKQTSITPKKYLNSMRMKRAKTLLQYSDMNITQISEAVGFKNIHYFSRTFSQYMNESPTEYRRNFVITK
jgi:AraC-like DNA-binding protein